MLSIVLICLGLVADDGAQPPAKAPPDRAAYEAARNAAGQDAAANVRLALWCEQHGMTAERMKHLATAVLHDPSNGLARGLLGLVAYDGKWEPPDEVSRKAEHDPRRQALMEEYLRRRAKAPDKADDQAKLAAWCDQNGLKAQAVAHYHAVLRLDPRREAAWKHLGFKKSGGRWVKPEQQAAARHEAEEQARANKHWRPLLEQWRAGLAHRDKARRASAEVGLAGVTDPRAVPMIWAVFALHGAEGQKTAVRVLGQIDAPGSSQALAMLAASGKSAEVRGEAMQVLRGRDPRDFAPMLIGLIRDPIRYEVKPVNGRGKPGELVIKDGSTNRKRVYTPLSEPDVALQPNDRVSIDPATGLPVVSRMIGFYVPPQPTMLTPAAIIGVPPPGNAGQIAGILQKAGLSPAQSHQLGQTLGANAASSYQVQLNSVGMLMNPIFGGDPATYLIGQTETLQIPIGQMELDAQRSAQVARQQLAGDVQAIDAYNAPILEANRRVRQVLSGVVGIDKGDDRGAWMSWLVDLFGYALAAQKGATDETTVIEQVPLSYQPQAAPMVQQGIGLVPYHHSCFGVGTPVRTLDGLRPIETLRLGDQVLTQNPRSGELKYQAVVEVYHNPPNATVRIAMEGGESIVATGIHRLWKAGKGWTMARELKPGDVLRTLGGLESVKSVEADRTQPVYNLQVADGESYFVGKSGVLAHDNSMISPVSEPFDAVGPLSTIPAAKPRSMLGR